MAYTDYGAFVYLNGERRTDKEDVGVYDTDEASLLSGLRVYANIMKHPDGFEWFEFSHHGVMGDGNVRVGCYYEEHDDTRYAADKYDEEFDFLGWHFHFWGNDYGDTPRYGATMSRDGETWECDYDYMFWDDSDDIH